MVDFAELKERLSIEEAIPLLGLEMRERNGQYRSPCPACKSGGDRALVITPAKGAYYCFADKKGGDVIALAAHINGTGMRDAALFLDGDNSSRNSTRNSPPEENDNRGAERGFQPLTYLKPDDPKLEPLEIAPETYEAFGAGYAPRGIHRGRLALPIHALDGTLIGYAGRAIDAEQSPVLTFPNGLDPEQYLFNGHQMEAGEELFLVRDPLDVLKAHEAGIENVVSFLTSTVNAYQLTLLSTLMDERGIETIELF